MTLSVSKRRGANAIAVVHAIEKKLGRPARRSSSPPTSASTVTRDYGETSSEKSNELLKHMGLATLSVALLMALALGRREAGVVLLAVPVTLALTLFVFGLFGYTLNRITLFALIFSIGILVDDAIVVVENIVRHLRLPEARGRSLAAVAVEATDEVGNPTILATFAVIAAIVPMGFVGGLMGPYMRPIPIGASAAMLFSLAVAFAVSPWAARRLFRDAPAGGRTAAPRRTGDACAPLPPRDDAARDGGPAAGAAGVFFAGIGVLLLGSRGARRRSAWFASRCSPSTTRTSSRSSWTFPRGRRSRRPTARSREMAGALHALPEVVGTEVYAGTPAPYNFNGLVRHYFLRGGPHRADVQVTFTSKGGAPPLSPRHREGGAARWSWPSAADTAPA